MELRNRINRLVRIEARSRRAFLFRSMPLPPFDYELTFTLRGCEEIKTKVKSADIISALHRDQRLRNRELVLWEINH